MMMNFQSKDGDVSLAEVEELTLLSGTQFHLEVAEISFTRLPRASYNRLESRF